MTMMKRRKKEQLIKSNRVKLSLTANRSRSSASS